jgi:dTDP-4-amino-4,6-dideoxygalactose transaminase
LAESLRAKKTETKKYFDLPLHQQLSSFMPNSTMPARTTEADRVYSRRYSQLPIYESLPDETVRTIAEIIQHIVHSACDRKAS